MVAVKSISESLVRFGLDFGVEKVPMYAEDCVGQPSGVWGVRKTSSKEILGVVGKNYVPLQNEVAFKPFQGFIDSGFAEIEKGGTFQNDAVVWMQARLKSDPITIVKGDDIQKYILLSHGHNGKMAVRFGFTPVRVICQNTLAMANRDRDSQLIRIKHSTQTELALQDIEKAMDLANATFNKTALDYMLLARKNITKALFTQYVTKVFSLKNGSETEKTKTSKVLEKMTKLFETGAGQDLSLVRGTYWAAYNAVTDHLTHSAGYDANKRLESSHLGESARINAKALDLALIMAT
jgi:phage/plasmid-like protein (TIGR03299 family)